MFLINISKLLIRWYHAYQHNTYTSAYTKCTESIWLTLSLSNSWKLMIDGKELWAAIQWSNESGRQTNVSCFRCNKNTRHVESSYILQPPKYLLLFVNRFRYINNNVTKDRCPIPMDTTVRLGPLKCSLQATINHHGPSIHSGHYTASINCWKKNILLQRSHNYGIWNYW